MKLTEKQVEKALSIFAIPKRGTIIAELTGRLNAEIELSADAKCAPGAGAEVKCKCGKRASFIIHGKALCTECLGAA